MESEQIILGLPTTMWKTGGISVKFKTIYTGIFIFAVLALFMDYLLTQIGFARLSLSLEENYLIKNLMNPYLASTTWFLMTLVMIITYKLAAYCQKGKLYSRSLDDIGRDLQSDGSLSIRDQAIFHPRSCINHLSSNSSTRFIQLIESAFKSGRDVKGVDIHGLAKLFTYKY